MSLKEAFQAIERTEQSYDLAIDALLANRAFMRELALRMVAADDEGDIDALRACCCRLCIEVGVELEHDMDCVPAAVTFPS